MKRAALLALAVALSGCCGSRTVTVEVPTRDAVNQAAPDTTLRTRPLALDTTGTETLPVAVDVNVSADTSATVCVTAIVQTDSTIEIRTPTGSQTFRSPDCGSGQVATYTPRPVETDPESDPETGPKAAPEAAVPEASGASPPDRSTRNPSTRDLGPRAADAPTAFDGRVRGSPRPRTLEVTCPACPTPVVGSGLWGWVKLLALLAVVFGVGVFTGRRT